MKTFLAICAAISVLGVCAGAEDKPVKAVAYLTGDTIRGAVYFSQSGCGQPVLVEVNVTGLTVGDHGFHIHERGDLTDGCTSLGAHYNPDKLNHGAPKDEIRHVGDLGNIRADANGVANTAFSDSLITLMGSRSIIGRGVIVHQDVDDLGKGGNADSLKTGNAGARAACGVVGFAEEDTPTECSSANVVTSVLAPFLSVIVFLLFKWN